MRYSPSRASGNDWEQRFWSKVEKTGHGGHWIWTGSVHEKGYGQFWVDRGKVRKAHRVAYELANRLTLPHFVQLHHAANCPKLCVNPAHMEEINRGPHQRRHAIGPRT